MDDTREPDATRAALAVIDTIRRLASADYAFHAHPDVFAAAAGNQKHAGQRNADDLVVDLHGWIERIRPENRRLAHDIITFHGHVAASYHEIAARFGEALLLRLRAALMFLPESDPSPVQDSEQGPVVPPVPHVRVVRKADPEQFASTISAFCASVDVVQLRKQVIFEARLPASSIAESHEVSEELIQKALTVWAELTEGARQKWLRAARSPGGAQQADLVSDHGLVTEEDRNEIDLLVDHGALRPIAERGRYECTLLPPPERRRSTAS